MLLGRVQELTILLVWVQEFWGGCRSSLHSLGELRNPRVSAGDWGTVRAEGQSSGITRYEQKDCIDFHQLFILFATPLTCNMGLS
jgi:hypothetical protein